MLMSLLWPSSSGFFGARETLELRADKRADILSSIQPDDIIRAPDRYF
jgi:hypothetical protein